MPLAAPVIDKCSRSSQPEEVVVEPGYDVLWLPEDATTGPLSVEIDGPRCQDALDLAYPRVARELYHMPTGYRLIVPPEGAIVAEYPAGHAAIYTHHFEFGLRLPLYSFLVEITNAFNLCLAQLTPLVVRNLIVYIWVVRFLDFPQTINLFLYIHWLKKNGSSRQAGWWWLTTADKDAFFWLRVPENYPARRHCTKPGPHMEHLPLVSLSEEELTAFDYFNTEDFEITYEDGKTTSAKDPKYWIPHSKYILGNKPLSVVLLSRTHENGK